MSSATSKRYQSRLFNFVYKRSRRLTERLNRALQNVTSWIMPVVTYPAQVLHAAVDKSLPQLPKLHKPDSPPTADTPVKNVLQLVEKQVDEELSVVKLPSATPVNFLGWLRDKFFAKTNAKRHPLKVLTNNVHLASNPSSANINRQLVRGIASYISNRALVLVTPENEILDILDNQQQQHLQARIIAEVAQYWRYQRLLATSRDATEQLQLPAQESLPVGLFSNISTWLQARGRLRKSSDRTTENTYDERGELIFATQQAIAFLDRSIAQFEANHLAPVADNATKTDKFQIQALIWAAIDYFFGDRKSNKLQPNQLKNNLNLLTTNNPNLLTASEDKIADPWLTLDDLFGESGLIKQPALLSNSASLSSSQLPEDANLTRSAQLSNKYSLHSLIKRIQPKGASAQLAKKSQVPTQLAKGEQQKTHIRVISKLSNIPKQLNSKKETSTAFNLTNSVVPQSSTSTMKHTPDWIETEATTMGYIKHPLEQLLAWLDSAMLWLENLLVKIWQQLQQLLIGK